ncbi:MAG: TetR/AcrR family transcriptional regulator [Phycisphaerales bacterium]
MLEWVRAPQQERTRVALTRMLDAAEALVAEKGFEAAGIAEIAQRAGSSVGGFYRRFHDKQGMLQALHERFCEDARATADLALDPARWVGAPTDEIITEFTAFLVRIYRDREGLTRAFLVSGIGDETVRQRTRELIGYLHTRLHSLLAERRADIGHPDPELAITIGFNMMLGALNHAIQLQLDELGLFDDRFAGELPRAFLGYLGVRATPSNP